jgi:hypothetical protein
MLMKRVSFPVFLGYNFIYTWPKVLAKLGKDNPFSAFIEKRAPELLATWDHQGKGAQSKV